MANTNQPKAQPKAVIAQILDAIKDERRERALYALLLAGLAGFCFAFYHAPGITLAGSTGLSVVRWISRLFGR